MVLDRRLQRRFTPPSAGLEVFIGVRMMALREAMVVAKKTIHANGWDCFDAVNSLAVLSAHLEEFREQHPDKCVGVDECLRVINRVDPPCCSSASLEAAVIALEGRIEALLRADSLP